VIAIVGFNISANSPSQTKQMLVNSENVNSEQECIGSQTVYEVDIRYLKGYGKTVFNNAGSLPQVLIARAFDLRDIRGEFEFDCKDAHAC